MNGQCYLSRGDYWFSLLTTGLTQQQTACASVRAAEGVLDGQWVQILAVVPDAKNPYPRARQGEVGLLEGWILARQVHEVINADAEQVQKRAIIMIIDVPSQAYGRREEALGLHQALAGAVSAYAQARLAGHPLVGLIVGQAMSGAFLAHGYQANALIALDDPQVMIHAMGKASAARITQRSVMALEQLTATIPPMAYDVANYASLGLLSRLLTLKDADRASVEEVDQVKLALQEAIITARHQEGSLAHRLQGKHRASSRLVRERIRAEW